MDLIFNHPYVGVVFLGALKDVSFTKSPIHCANSENMLVNTK